MNNNSKPLISIAMCTYNGERFIKEQLDSILNQTYKNIEVIITDDCSTDTTIKIIEKYMIKDKRIKLYINEKNLGFLKNFEKVISLCKGDFIALADQDDIWKLNKIEIFKDEIKDNILIYSDADLVDEFSNSLNQQLIQPKKNLIKGKNNQAFLFNNCVSGNTLMFKKELLNYILPIAQSIKFHDTWIAFIASTIGTITYTSDSLTYYRRYQGQVTFDEKKKYKSFFKKYINKRQLSVESANNSLKLYHQLLKLDFLDDKTKYLIHLLQEHYKTFEYGFFNIKLYQYLQNNKDQIFAIIQERRRNRLIKKVSMKLKFRKLLLFSN